MARQGKHRRQSHKGRHRRPHAGGGRVTPRGTTPQDAVRRHRLEDVDRSPDLLAVIRARLATGDPFDLLAEISSLVSAVDPRSQTPLIRARRQHEREERAAAGRSATHARLAAGSGAGEGQDPERPTTLDELVRSFAGVDRLETTALLAGIAVLAPDELVRARARRAVAGRDHVLPPWLAGLGAARAGRTMEMVHVLGDGDDLMVEIQIPAGGASKAGRTHTLTMTVYVDHNMGTVVKDAFPVPGPVTDLVQVMKAHAETLVDTTWRDLDPADARVRIIDAVEHGARMFPPIESETWPACRPMVEWAARLLPPGGRGYERPQWDDRAKEALAEAFFGSPSGALLRHPDDRHLFDALVWFATDYGPGDPLRWSPVAVEIVLLDWLPRKIAAPASFLRRAPDVLRAFIAYSHAERGIRRELTEETLQAVDRYEPEFQEAIRSPRPQGPAALLAAMGALDPDGPWDLPEWPSETTDFDDDEDELSPGQAMLQLLSDDVGGGEALDALHDRPLPDEPFAWDGIDPGIVDRVADVLAACDRCCDDLLDVEYRTACRRFLARVARTGPEVFRRRGRADTAAAAICWAVGKANDLFGPSRGRMFVKDLLGYFGLSTGSVSQRAVTFMKAAGLRAGNGYFGTWNLSLGDPELLVSSRRRTIIERRDRWREREA